MDSMDQRVPKPKSRCSAMLKSTSRRIWLPLFCALTLVAGAQASDRNGGARIVDDIPAAAKKRDLALIDKFLDAVIQGREAEARDMLDPYYSAGLSGDAPAKQINYSGDKLPKLKLFGASQADIEAVYYFQDVINQSKHLRYYFVIYRPGINQPHEVMRVELTNADHVFFLNNIWAPKKGD